MSLFGTIIKVVHDNTVGLVRFYGISTMEGYLMPNPFLYTSTNLFQAIQFSISTQFSSLWSIDRALSSATTPGQSEPGRDGNKGVLHIPQSSSITEASASDCLVPYQGHSLGGVLRLCRDAVSVFFGPSWLGHCLVQNEDFTLRFCSYLSNIKNLNK